MSWLFSRVLVEEYLVDTCSDGEPSALLSGNLTPLAYLPPDKMTDFSRLSRFGVTFKPLTENRGEELLMSFREDFHAKTFQPQDEVPVLTENAQECGDTWRGWLAKFDPVSCSWKTAQCSLLEDLNESSLTLPRSGMTQGGLLWELPTLKRRTNETEYGSLPNNKTYFHTPNTKGLDGGSNSRKALKKRQNWPTPQASDNRPRATANVTARRIAIGKQVSLEAAVKFWPTPAARDYKGANGFDTTNQKLEQGKRAQMGQLPNALQQELGKPIGGTLNPMWVEWLMGWPLGWTDLKPLEMDKSHCVPPPLGDS